MGNVMREALDMEVCHYPRLSRLIMDGGSAELRSFVTCGFCLMVTPLLSLLSSYESSEMPLPFPTILITRKFSKADKPARHAAMHLPLAR